MTVIGHLKCISIFHFTVLTMAQRMFNTPTQSTSYPSARRGKKMMAHCKTHRRNGKVYINSSQSTRPQAAISIRP
jgi:ribosomal protein L36